MDKQKNNLSLLIGVPGILVQVLGFAAGPILAPTLSINTDFAVLLGLGVSLIGTVMLIAGMCIYASAKEQSPWWGLMGLLGIIGLIVLSVLPDKHLEKQRRLQVQQDISAPPQPSDATFHCLTCNYVLNGTQGSACPECGRPFDPQNLSTVRIDNPNFSPKAPWTSRWSLMFGIMGLLASCIPLLGLLFPIGGVVCGHAAYYSIKRSRDRLTGKGVALAGLIVSYIALASSLFFQGLFIVAILG